MIWLVLMTSGVWGESQPQPPEATISLAGTESGRLYALAFSPDGKWLAVGGTGKNLHIVDVAALRLHRTILAHPDAVWSVAWSADSRQLFSGGRADPVLRVWDAATGAELESFLGHRGGITAIRTFDSGDGLMTAGGSWDPSLRVWSVAGRKLLRSMTGHTDLVDAMDVTKNGRWAVTGSRDGTLRLWDVQRGQEIWTHRVEMQGGHGGYLSVAFSPDGRLFAAGLEDGGLVVRETMTRRRYLPAKERGGETRALAFSPDGRWFAFADSSRRISLGHARTGQIAAVYHGHRGEVFVIDFSPDGQRLASAGADAVVCLWRVPPWQEERKELSESERQSALDRLSSEHPSTARHAMNDLICDTGPASEAIAARFRRESLSEASSLGSTIARLASPRFSEREQAAEELVRLGEMAEVPLRQAWSEAREPEQRRRLDRILNRLARAIPSPESLAQRRAIAVLEARADAAAKDTLRRWAEDTASWTGIEAAEALQRLASPRRSAER